MAKDQFRRGFKKEAAELANEVRTELKLQPRDQLDPRKLAAYLEIKIENLSSFKSVANYSVVYFSGPGKSQFSAMTVFDGRKRLIILNDFHSKNRQASSIAHELSHALLLPEPTPALDSRGCRNWNPEIESEAEWLAGVLLVTEEAALDIAQRKVPLEQAAQMYGVSLQMMQFRINVTGALKRAGFFEKKSLSRLY